MPEPRAHTRAATTPSLEPARSLAPLSLEGLDVEAAHGSYSEEETRLRRARFTRYVRWTMGACVALCLAGATRKLVIDPSASADETPHASASFTLPAPQDSPPPADAPVAAVTSPAIAPEHVTADPKEAKREKKAAQDALNRGKLDAAIRSASRAIALDPTDAETFLVLGAAYMEKRETASARRAFQDCGKTATHGPKGECAAMLR